jgi:hypothetical protein
MRQTGHSWSGDAGMVAHDKPLARVQPIGKNGKKGRSSHNVTGITLVGSSGGVWHISNPATE